MATEQSIDGTTPALDIGGPVGLSEVYGQANENIANNKGNFLVTVGNPGSGKSSLQNYLIWRLWYDEQLYFEYGSEYDTPKHDANLNAWVQDFADGFLPARTTTGLLQKYTISFGQKSRPNLALSFLEVSGEDIVPIVPSQNSDGTPALESQLTELLASECNFRFLFVADSGPQVPSRSRVNEDVLFSTLLKHLIDPNGIGKRKIRVLFVASKWDLGTIEFRSEREFFMKRFPQTRAVVSSTERITASYVPFSVGKVEIDKSNRPRISRPSKTSGAMVLNWIYYSFTGRELAGFPRVKTTLLDRVKYFFGR
jgi:energy-coupling factor transporter ATP-binding protein EcfA2